MLSERTKYVLIEYDPGDNILHFSFDGIDIQTSEELTALFDGIVSFWRRNCMGRKVYVVVNYDGLQINPRLTEEYAVQLGRQLDIALAVIRYGGSSIQRTSARLANMKLHAASRICASREEAFAAVRALKADLASPRKRP